MDKLISLGIDLATNPKHTKWMIPLLVLVDAAFCALIIWKQPYTEIDWTTYMQQIEIYLKGERDYRKIDGDTGPLVYPAAHVYIYRILYALTENGTNIFRAQQIFGGVYLLTLATVMACYRNAKVPPYVYPLLILSPRMHSLYMLRCFNDCFAALGLFAAIYAFQKDQWHLGSFLYTTGLNVKMTLLLPLPVIGILALQALGSREAITQAMIIFQVSVGYGYPFLHKNTPSYAARAFDFSRQFLYKWTVNWRFVPEALFLSKPFALSLLALNAVFLVHFARTRWIKPSQRNLKGFLKLIGGEARDQDRMAQRITPQFIMTTILSAMTIGLLFARSLHYQFYAYIGWTTPYLRWRAGFHPIIQYVLWAAETWAWMVFPSTPISSVVVVSTLAMTVAGVWWGTRNEFELVQANGTVHEHTE